MCDGNMLRNGPVRFEKGEILIVFCHAQKLTDRELDCALARSEGVLGLACLRAKCVDIEKSETDFGFSRSTKVSPK